MIQIGKLLLNLQLFKFQIVNLCSIFSLDFIRFKNKERRLEIFDLFFINIPYNLTLYQQPNLFSLPNPTDCMKIDGMLDIFSTPSNSPYLSGEPISFCGRQFPSPSIGGRVSLPREISFLLFLWGMGVVIT